MMDEIKMQKVEAEKKENRTTAYVGQAIQQRVMEESQATQSYMRLVEEVNGWIDVEEDDRKEVKKVIDQIVSEELKHIEQLNYLFTKITSIKPEK